MIHTFGTQPSCRLFAAPSATHPGGSVLRRATVRALPGLQGRPITPPVATNMTVAVIGGIRQTRVAHGDSLRALCTYAYFAACGVF